MNLSDIYSILRRCRAVLCHRARETTRHHDQSQSIRECNRQNDGRMDGRAHLSTASIFFADDRTIPHAVTQRGPAGDCRRRHDCICTTTTGWLASQVVSVLDSGAEGPGFESQPRRCRVTVLGRGKSGPALGGTEYRLMPSACRLIVRQPL